MRSLTITSPFNKDEVNELEVKSDKEKRDSALVWWALFLMTICLGLGGFFSLTVHLKFAILLLGLAMVMMIFTALFSAFINQEQSFFITEEETKELQKKINHLQDESAARFFVHVLEQEREMTREEYNFIVKHVDQIISQSLTLAVKELAEKHTQENE